MSSANVINGGLVPSDTLLIVFSLLDSKSLNYCLSVCKHWNKLINNTNQLWYEVYTREIRKQAYNPNVKYQDFYKKRRNIQKRSFESLTEFFYTSPYKSIHHSESLSLVEKIGIGTALTLIGIPIAVISSPFLISTDLVNYIEHRSTKSEIPCKCNSCKLKRDEVLVNRSSAPERTFLKPEKY